MRNIREVYMFNDFHLFLRLLFRGFFAVGIAYLTKCFILNSNGWHLFLSSMLIGFGALGWEDYEKPEEGK